MDSSIPDALRDGVLNLNGKSWLTSRGDVSDLIQALQMGKNFFMRVVCTPVQVKGAGGRIISISKQDGLSNLSLLQRDGNLVFWFRNLLNVRRDQLLFSTIPRRFHPQPASRYIGFARRFESFSLY